MANDIFKRYEGNPILTPDDVSNANSVFNSAAVKFKGKFAGIFRVDTVKLGSELRTGFSDDGIKWNISDDPVKMKNKKTKKFKVLQGGAYDPRITEINGVFYFTWCYYPGGNGPCIGLGATKDFINFEFVSEVMLPYDRNAVLFPRKIKGKFAALHRPSDPYHTAYGDIYYCESNDLVHWGEHKFIFGPSAWWQRTKVGPGPTPIEIKEGWLMIYHGVRQTCSGFVYCAGGAILDKNEPWKVKYRSKAYLLAPYKLYETTGDVPNVVFPNSVILDEKTGKMTMYYGAADTVLCIAEANLDEVIKFIKANSK